MTIYRGHVIALATRHGKQNQIGPPFADVLGAHLVVPPNLDTDRLGTFSGEVPRQGSAQETVRAKARLGMSVTGFPMGLASEASYDMLPGLGCSRHEEILVFIDDLRGLEVVERHSCAAPFVMSHRVSTVAELPVGILDEMPEQAMIVRPSAGDCRGRIEKGITEIASLQHAIARAAAASTDGKALLEPDLRAFHNPNRREVLTQLSYRLARRLNTRCPACGAPGFGRVGVVPGLRCRYCLAPTGSPMAEVNACSSCRHRSVENIDQWADPAHCPSCNP